jgi:hypothetical protein
MIRVCTSADRPDLIRQAREIVRTLDAHRDGESRGDLTLADSLIYR